LLTGLKSRIAHSADALITLGVIAALLALPGLLLPSFSRVFVDDILVRQTEHWLMPLILGILATGLVAATLVHLQQRLLLKLDSKLAVVEAVQLFWGALHLSPRFYEQRSPSEVASRVRLADQLASAIGGPLGTALSAWLSGLIFLLFMMVQDWLLATVVLALGVTQFLVLTWTLRHIDEDSRRLAHAQAQGEATALSILGMLPTWRASGAEPVAMQKWRDSIVRACNAQQQAAGRQVWLQAVPTALTGLTTGSYTR
jgi:ABC-type bacteriocin/lantibiotic exporter with double-glycine peptidase domain